MLSATALLGASALSIAFLSGSALLGVILFVLGLAGAFLLAVWQENSLLLRLELVTPLEGSLRAQLDTLEHLLQSTYRRSGPLPSLYVCADPLPAVQIYRSLGSPGVMVLHLGLLQRLTDEEWLALLPGLMSAMDAPDAVLRSLCYWLRTGLARILPSPWRERTEQGEPILALDLVQGRPVAALWVLGVWPLFRYLKWLEGATPPLSRLRPRGYNPGHVQA